MKAPVRMNPKSNPTTCFKELFQITSGKKAEKAKLPPDAIAHMKKMEKDAIEFRKFMKDL